MDLVPVVDIRNPGATSLAELDHACADHGFFLLTGHGLDDVIADTFAAARRFFDSPFEVKDGVRRDGRNPLGYNERELTNDPVAHAEVLALRDAAQHLGQWRLDECTLYVTLEPCAMCAGAAVNARIKRLVFGTRDLRFGAVRSKFRLADSDLLHHRIEIVEGVLAAECVERLRRFFEKLRH